MHLGLICWTCGAKEGLFIEGDLCTCPNGHVQRVRNRGNAGWVARHS